MTIYNYSEYNISLIDLNCLLPEIETKLINYLILHLEMRTEQQSKMIEETISFVSYFTNNYRPIFHLEKYIYSIIKIIHKLD